MFHVKQQAITVAEFRKLAGLPPRQPYVRKTAPTPRQQVLRDQAHHLASTVTPVGEPMGTPYKGRHRWRHAYRGVVYDSKGEALYAAQLDALLKLGVLSNVERQFRFSTEHKGVRLTPRGYVRVDFRITFADGHVEYHDWKPWPKQDVRWPILKRWILAEHGIDVVEAK